MTALALKNICKIYGKNTYAVKNFDLEVEKGEFIIFVGPSGCGKSTTLRMIAGLEEISKGELWVNDKLMNYVDPQQRELSMVFQNYALYPNMKVYDNLAFSLQIRKISKKEIDQRVREVAGVLQIDSLLDRYPGALSGGQKQRVAIGSALIRNPEIFLMDEPLSNLDAKLRAQMRVELGRLHKELGTTIIYVTHDQTEAMTLGTRIVVMKEGVIQQIDSPANLYNDPANRFVAEFIGSPSMNFIEAECVMKPKWYFRIKNEGQKIDHPFPADFMEGRKSMSSVILGIRPENIYTEQGRKNPQNAAIRFSDPIRVELTAKELLGAEVNLYFEIGNSSFCARAEAENENRTGEWIDVYLDLDKIQFFDSETEVRLR